MANATTTEIGPGDNLATAVAALGAGDELVLQGGTYNLNGFFSISKVGSPAAPVVIRAKSGEQPVIVQNDLAQNVINVASSQYLVLRGLELTGGGGMGLRIAESNDVTVEECKIHDVADVGVRVLSASSTSSGMRFSRNEIYATNGVGTGIYLGCTSDSCRVANSTVEDNYIHDTVGTQGDGIAIRAGSYGNFVRDNVIHDTPFPGINVQSTLGHGARNVVERNAIWGGTTSIDCGIAAVDEIVIRDNLVFGTASGGIILAAVSGGAPKNFEILHNTVLATGANRAVRVTGLLDAGDALIANNALYSQSGNAIDVAGLLGTLTVSGNYGAGGLVGPGAGFTASGSLAADFVSASYGTAPPMNLFPKTAGGLLGAGTAAYVSAVDFDGVPRHGVADAGAYLYRSGSGPAWTLAGERKFVYGIFQDDFESGAVCAWSARVGAPSCP